MVNLKKWDFKVLAEGNGIVYKPTKHRGFLKKKTDEKILGAWGRKKNLKWIGRLDAGGSYGNY